jgi:hypothetical protein
VISPRTLWRRFKEWVRPPRQLVVVEGDALPAELPVRHLVVLRGDGENWSVAMQCPCGCGQRVELPLIPEAKPRWTLKSDERNRPTLHPSVWLREGCRSHFLVRSGKVVWV